VIKENLYKESIKIEKELKQKYNENVIRVSNYDSHSENTYNEITSYEKIVLNINIFIIGISIIFIAVFLICILNCVSDELSNLKCEKILGYSNFNLYFQLFIEEFLMVSLSFGLSIIISIFLIHFVKYYSGIKIKYVYINNLLFVYIITLIYSFILSFIKTKKSINTKSL